MKFVILFEDSRSADPGIRQRLMPEHLAFLEAHAEEIEAAGPLRDGTGAAAGGLWIVEAESEAAAERLVKADPFWPTGLREEFRILAWTQVYAAGRRLAAPV
jgi:uncharacterized protein YciI